MTGWPLVTISSFPKVRKPRTTANFPLPASPVGAGPQGHFIIDGGLCSPPLSPTSSTLPTRHPWKMVGSRGPRRRTWSKDTKAGPSYAFRKEPLPHLLSGFPGIVGIQDSGVEGLRYKSVWRWVTDAVILFPGALGPPASGWPALHEQL